MIEFVLVITFLLLVVGPLCQRHHEKKMWNNGICRSNGEKWISFDMDSQGGRGYRAADYYCWISYNVDIPE